MKKSCLSAGSLSIMAAALAFTVGCVVQPNGQVGVYVPTFAVAPVVVAPPPAVVVEPATVEVGIVPEVYVEVPGCGLVGEVGGVNYYLNNGVWIVCDPYRLERFHVWERGNADWRHHAIRNDRFRKDAHGHVVPHRNGGQRNAPASKDRRNER